MVEAAKRYNILFRWVYWHFGEAAKAILRGWKNFLLFTLNYFSVPQLTKTLFSHWRRYRESYGRGFDPKRYLSAFVGNMISRTLGAIVRFFVIIVGLAAEVVVFGIGLIIFLVWIFLPVFLILAIAAGIGLLI